MNTPIAYLGGRLIPQADVSVSPTDAGFILGATVSEQLRTFAGEVFRLDDHLDRFARSLQLVGLADRVSIAAVRDGLQQVVAHNYPLAMADFDNDAVDDNAVDDSAVDLGVTVFATPGPYAGLSDPDAPQEPTVCVHSFPLPFRLWAACYAEGQPLATTDVVQVSPRCWPRELKCRSRLHYYLADRQAAQREPGARALLLDEAGHVNEMSTANVVAVLGGNELVTPPDDDVLHGISMAEVKELAEEAGFSWTARPITLAELADGEELLLTSTPYCLLPCCRLNGERIGTGTPGPVFAQLLAAWSNKVGIDIAGQAQRGAA